MGIGPGPNGTPMTAAELSAWDGRVADLEAPPRRAFKTHAPAQLVPWKGGLGGLGTAKVIVVTRNPKDACVSMFHHARDIEAFRYRGDLHHFATRLFLEGNVESGCFWAWHAGWEEAAAKHPQNVIWVSYEDLKRDFPGTVRKLAEFLDVPLTGDTLAQVTDASSMKSMKASYEAASKHLSTTGGEAKKNHIRKGEMGSWRNDIKGALLAEFDAVHRAKTDLHKLRYQFDFGGP
uniref:Sulfotransferase domain-containing protein n=1 Tax=Alexandrium catenella TaxID=2925 RepID=A0A7S1LLZ4_ALECA